MEANQTKRRSFVQRMVCLFGGAVGASALQRQASAGTAAQSQSPANGSLQYHLKCRHQHGQQSGRVVCKGEILDPANGQLAGEFYSNCFCAESAIGTMNPFAASNIEMHTLRLEGGTIFGMGANNASTEPEKVHAIIGGTGRFAGARGTYRISESSAKNGAVQLTVNLMS